MLLIYIADIIVTSEGIMNLKNLIIKQVIQNIEFAKSQKKPHTKSIFKHFGLSVPNLRKLNPARIRLRMTQIFILHGGP